MIALAGDAGRLRPHVKTHKTPQIIAIKLAAGINKFKASTIAEAEMTAAAGGKDILIAYQPVGPNVGRTFALIEKFPDVRFSTLVDNLASLQAVSAAAVAHNLVVELLVDLNVGMNRTGIQVDETAAQLYRKLCGSPGIVPGGLHAYDGHLHEPDLNVLSEQAHDTFEPVWRLREQLQRLGCAVPKVVAAGTPTTRFLAQHEGVEVGAGTPVLWDFGQTEISPDLEFQNAAVLLTRVVSHPAKHRICIDLGYKAVASEMPQPRVRFFGLEDAAVVTHSEEHLVLETQRSASFPVGTVLYGIPRHICPTVALHSDLWCVSNGRAVEKWPVVARTRCITI